MRGIEEVVLLARHGPQHTVLLLYGHRLLLVRLPLGTPEAAEGEDQVAQRPTDLLGAVDESAQRLFLQALKPLNQLVNGVQVFERKWKGRTGEDEGEGPGPDAESQILWALELSDLQDARAGRDAQGTCLRLTVAGGNQLSLPLYLAPMAEAACFGLVTGLRSAVVHSDSYANWEELHDALREEQRSRQERDAHGGLPLPTEAGHRTTEVYEVERWRIASGRWETPFLPTDRELSWRWVDATGRKHPHLQKLSKAEIVKKREPPCEFDALFKATSDWAIERNSATDCDGWRYGLAWKSSTWDVTPGIFDGLRKRKWHRTYT
mmetsp:Transcript_24774/g.77175  ORF Transcript_24774/g.77175 Transcript_24774/m.77175 type:complete len:321 (-) Transcript_24774:263-1225(-)